MERKRIIIDPGHGGKDPGAEANGLLEKNLVLDICGRVKNHLSVYEADILLTRDSDTTVSLKKRASIANNYIADFFLSIHCNAGGGEGFESYVYLKASVDTLSVRETLHQEVAGFCLERNIADRGMKAANFAVLRLTKMPAILLEVLFIDHPEDAERLQNIDFLNDIAASISLGVVKAIKLRNKSDDTVKTRTLAKYSSDTQPEQARRFLKDKNPLAPDYVDIYTSMEAKYGIRWDAVFAQSCMETGFWKFGGSVKPEQNNFAGLASFDGKQGASFPTPEKGIEAQFQHWHVYYNGGELPAGSITLDPRRNAVLSSGWAGKLECVEDLGGHWAPSQEYGISIVRDYMVSMKNIDADTPWDPQLEINKLKNAGLIVSDHRPEDFVTWGEFATVINKILKTPNSTL